MIDDQNGEENKKLPDKIRVSHERTMIRNQ